MASDPMSNIELIGNSGYISDGLALISGAAERMAPLTESQLSMGQGRDGSGLKGLLVVTATMDGWCRFSRSSCSVGVHRSLRGLVLMMDQSTSLPDFARAVMKGVALSARHVLGALVALSGTPRRCCLRQRQLSL